MSTLSLTKKARIYNGEKTAVLITVIEETRQLYVKEWTKTISNSIHKNKLKMD